MLIDIIDDNRSKSMKLDANWSILCIGVVPGVGITRFFLYKHHHYKHRQPQIWPKIKHHLSTSLSLTSLQHTNFVYANYFNFPIISVKINLSYNFGALNYSSLQIFKFLWLGYTIDEHKSYKVRIAYLTLPAKYYPNFQTSTG